jgi:hypothetical protein
VHYTLIFTALLHIKSHNYHTLCIFTLPVSVSYRDLTRRTAPTNSSRELTETELQAAKSSAYKPSIVLAALLLVAWEGCLRSYWGNSQVRAVLRHRVYSSVTLETIALPCDVIAAARRRLRFPSPLRSVYSVANCLADAA